MTDSPILYQKLEPALIAYIKTPVDTRDEIPPLFERLRAACGDAIGSEAADTNHPMVIFHGGAVKDGFLVEAAIPVTRPVETGEVHTRILETAPALTARHYGAHKTIRETVLNLYDYLGQHAWTTSLLRREIYRVLDPSDPAKNVTEVQVILHEWDRLLAEGVEKILRTEARQNLMQGIESITPDSSFDDYSTWIQNAIICFPNQHPVWMRVDIDINSPRIPTRQHCQGADGSGQGEIEY